MSLYSTLSEANGSTWFEQEDSAIHNQVFAHVSFLNNIQSYRNAENVKNMRLNYMASLNWVNSEKISR